MKTLSIKSCRNVRALARGLELVSGIMTAVAGFGMYGSIGRIDYYTEAHMLTSETETAAVAASVLCCILMLTCGYATTKLDQFVNWLDDVIYTRELNARQRREALYHARHRAEMDTDIRVAQ